MLRTWKIANRSSGGRPVVTLVTGTTVVKVETNVVGATDAVIVDTVAEVLVAIRGQMLETRDAGSCATIEGADSA